MFMEVSKSSRKNHVAIPYVEVPKMWQSNIGVFIRMCLIAFCPHFCFFFLERWPTSSQWQQSRRAPETGTEQIGTHVWQRYLQQYWFMLGCFVGICVLFKWYVFCSNVFCSNVFCSNVFFVNLATFVWTCVLSIPPFTSRVTLTCCLRFAVCCSWAVAVRYRCALRRSDEQQKRDWREGGAGGRRSRLVEYGGCYHRTIE